MGRDVLPYQSTPPGYGCTAGPVIRAIWRYGPAHRPFHLAIAALLILVFSAPLSAKFLPPLPARVLASLTHALWFALFVWWFLCSVVTFIRSEPVQPGEWRVSKWWIALILTLSPVDSHGSRVLQFCARRPELEQELALMAARVGPRALAEPAHFPAPIGHFLDNNGFAYLPTPPPADLHWKYEHITGPWYIYLGG